MRTLERFFVYAGLTLALILALRAPTPAVSTALAAGSGKDRPEATIAVCSVMRITDELMESDRYKPKRTEFEEGLRKNDLMPLYEQLKALQKRLEGMARDDPHFEESREQFLRLQREAGRVTQEITQKVEGLVAEQLTECYQLVRASAVAVAEDLRFNYVLASTDPETKLKSGTVVSLVRDLLTRPVLLAPKEVDITEDVRKDLKLE